MVDLYTILHTINYFQKDLREEINQIILLQPTFPLRDVLEIKSALNIFKIKNLSSLVSVTKMKEHPCECITISEKDSKVWSFLVNPLKETNRQSYFGSHFFINGNFYIADIETDGINTASAANIRGVPTVIVYKKGTETNRIVGGVPEGKMKEFLEENI